MIRIAERVLWLTAVLTFAVYVLSVGETRVYQDELNSQFTQEVQIAAAAPPAKPTLGSGDVVGRIEISSIGLSAMIAEGVESRTLRRSVGHIPGTALPGDRGNVGLSGHRDTFFRRLGELRPGSRIAVTSLRGTFRYVVESTAIADPDESAVLRDVGRPTLTLVTCYPFYHVGPAPKRFVVHAGLLDEAGE